MNLQGDQYPNAWDASGVRNFFGEGYAYHATNQRLFGEEFSFGGSVFVAKTVTFEPRKGNMPMQADGVTPSERMPKCIFVSPWSYVMGAAVNAVGLTNLGLEETLARGKWQAYPEPMCISYAPTGETPAKRLGDAVRFVIMLREEMRRKGFLLDPAVQINLSCPNTKEEFDLVEEGLALLGIFSELDVLLIIKVNALESVENIREVGESPFCAAVTTSNTIPWDSLSERERARYFLRKTSPLKRRGFSAGGVSGQPVFHRMVNQVKALRAAGFRKPIIAGGGILGPRDVKTVRDAGADAATLGSTAFLRPWRLALTIAYANAYEPQ